MESLGLAGDGTVQVPRDSRDAGWYDLGPTPGDVGPAVVLGHLDWYNGPAVFARLATLRAGDQVFVDRADGSQARFLVDRLATFSVDSFPTEQVYGATPDPTLRLITCGGTFSRSQNRYLSNVVVFASEAT
jgi:sortase (surface protein transpeptidase)